MARPYSEKFMLDLNKADPTRIGVQLGKICVKANLPTSYVAETFDVSRMSIHNWFRGQYVRAKNYDRIVKFIDKINQGLDKGILPAPTMKVAKNYLDAIRDKV